MIIGDSITPNAIHKIIHANSLKSSLRVKGIEPLSQGGNGSSEFVTRT